MPLPLNVSIDALPEPEFIVMDTFDKALQNNQNYLAAQNNQFFAYVAESYTQLPSKTVIGDGDTSGGAADPCNLLFLTRYRPMDSALPPFLKYTGFLAVRVDRDKSLYVNFRDMSDRHITARLAKRQTFPNFPLELINQAGTDTRFNFRKNQRPGTTRRQLNNQDPAYGFSGYFKPIVLQSGKGTIIWHLLFIYSF